jgi:hypothetical protein
MAKDRSTNDLGEMLLVRYGAVLGGRDLRKALGYRSATAFSQAVRNRVVPIRFFTIDGRRGYFALATDVGEWLEMKASQGPRPGSVASRKKEG